MVELKKGRWTGKSRVEIRKYMSMMRAIRKKNLRNKPVIGCSHAKPDMCQKCVSLFEQYEELGILTSSSSGFWFFSDYKLKLSKEKN